MGLRKFLNIYFLISFSCILLFSTESWSAQVDSTIVSTTSVVDSVIEKGGELSSTKSQASTLIDTSVDTTAYAQYMIKPEQDRSPLYQSILYYALSFLVVCMVVAILGKILRVYELARSMQGKRPAINWGSLQAGLFVFILIIGLYGAYWSYTVHGAMSFRESGSVHGARIDFMFKITLILTTIVFVCTHCALFAFVFKYRGNEKKKAYFYPHNNLLEQVWTIIPATVLTVLVILGFFTWRSITNISEEDQKKAIKIEVVGEQFKWHIRYPGTDQELGEKNYKLISPTNSLGINFKDKKSWDDQLAGEIVIPVNRPIRVIIGSKDVLHSFYVPTLRVQMNAVPGMPTHFQFTPSYTTSEMREKQNDPTFDYILLCAKICGSGHYNMQAKIRVVSENEYQAWLAKQPLYYNDDVKKEMQANIGFQQTQ